MEPFQNALQFRLMFMLAVSCVCSHALLGRYPRACSLRRVSSYIPVRAEWVSPAECPAGTVQLVPPLAARSRSPAAEVSLTAPHASRMRV